MKALRARILNAAADAEATACIAAEAPKDLARLLDRAPADLVREATAPR